MQGKDTSMTRPRDCESSTGAVKASCSGNPFQCASPECISLLLRLSFSRAEVEELLLLLSRESEPHDLKLGAAYRRLTELALYHPEAAQRLDQALAAKLASAVGPMAGCPLVQLATYWTQTRDALDGQRAAALLWTVARSPAACHRKLESVMVDDLNYLAARSLVQRPSVPGLMASNGVGP